MSCPSPPFPHLCPQKHISCIKLLLAPGPLHCHSPMTRLSPQGHRHLFWSQFWPPQLTDIQVAFHCFQTVPHPSTPKSWRKSLVVNFCSVLTLPLFTAVIYLFELLFHRHSLQCCNCLKSWSFLSIHPTSLLQFLVLLSCKNLTPPHLSHLLTSHCHWL